jgi:hypothetical protein
MDELMELCLAQRGQVEVSRARQVDVEERSARLQEENARLVAGL